MTSSPLLQPFVYSSGLSPQLLLHTALFMTELVAGQGKILRQIYDNVNNEVFYTMRFEWRV